MAGLKMTEISFRFQTFVDECTRSGAHTPEMVQVGGAPEMSVEKTGTTSCAAKRGTRTRRGMRSAVGSSEMVGLTIEEEMSAAVETKFFDFNEVSR